MSDTEYLDTIEKVDILLKSSFGFPSTSENKAWFQETAVPYNNYVRGEDLFLDNIPTQPDFDTNGTVKTASDIGLQNTDFKNYSDDSNDKSSCSVVDDSTGTIRRFKLLILEECDGLGGNEGGFSWFKKNTDGDNILKDTLQFNTNQYTDSNGVVQQPYLYKVFTENQTNSTLDFGQKGGNWNIDIKSGVLFFPDFNVFSGTTQPDSNKRINTTNNKPVLTIYKYIGKKGVANLSSDSVKENSTTIGTTITAGTKIVISKSDLSNLTKTTASSSGYPVYKLNSGLPNSEVVFRTTTHETYSDSNGTGIKGYAHMMFNPHIKINNSSQTFTVKITVNVTNYDPNERGKFYAGTMGRTFALDYIGTGEYISTDTRTTYNYNLASSVVGPDGVVSYTSTTGDFNPIAADGTGVNEKFDPGSEMMFIIFLPNYPVEGEDGQYNQITYLESVEIESNQDMVTLPRNKGTYGINNDLIFNLENLDSTYRESMRLNQNGRLGIGISTPSERLEVYKDDDEVFISVKNSHVRKYNKSGIKFKGHFTTIEHDMAMIHAENLRYGGSTISGTTYGSHGYKDLVFSIANPNNFTELQEKMRLTHNGRLGIGTDSPTYKLDVNGNIHTSGSIYMDSGSGHNIYCRYICYSTYFYTEGGSMYIDAKGAGSQLRLRQNGTDALTIDTNEYIGIGTTSPGRKLHVAINDSSNPIVRFERTGSSPVFVQISGHSARGVISSSEDLFLSAGNETATSDKHHLVINKTSGNVGIGTNAPDEKLDVSGNIKFNGSIYSGTSTIAGNALVSIGAGNVVDGQTSIAIGDNNIINENPHSIAIGSNNKVSDPNELGTGHGYEYDIVIGKNNTSNGGSGAACIGLSNTTYGASSVAMGGNNTANGTFSFSMGKSNDAGGQASVAMGESNQTNGYYSIAMGKENNYDGTTYVNSGEYSFAAGYRNVAAARGSIAMGNQNNYNILSGISSVAMGYKNKTKGDNSIAIGNQNNLSVDSGGGSVAMGYYNRASGDYSVAMGYDNTASGDYSVAMGHGNVASGNYSVAMSQQTTAIGTHSFSMGAQNLSWGDYSVAMGYGNKTGVGVGDVANYSVAMGRNNTASGDYSFAMGLDCSANGSYSVSMGFNNTASGSYSFAVGKDNTASGGYSFSTGRDNDANANYSVAMGRYNEVNNNYSGAIGVGLTIESDYSDGSFACGRYNKDHHLHLFAVGSGSSTSDRKTVIYATSTEFHCTGDIIAYSTSDSRVKTNLKNIENPLDKLQKINGYTFDWVENSEVHSNIGNDVGVIAQEVEEVLPEVVTTRDNGYKAVKYEKMVPLLIECIKSQQKQIDSQQKQINQLLESKK